MAAFSKIRSIFETLLADEEKKAKKEEGDVLAFNLLLKTSDIYIKDAGPVLSKYYERIHDITIVCTVLSDAKSKNQLIDVIGSEVEKYPLKKIQQMMENITEKTINIDEGYRRRLLKKIHEQIIDTHHTISILKDSRNYSDYRSAPAEKSSEYWLMVLEACRAKASKSDPHLLFLKYLLAGFSMFVQGEPAHPVGTPFPGGHMVEKDYRDYYCPVRDKADDVLYSVCHFCPAKQSPEFMLLYTGKQREKRKKNVLIK